MILSSFCIGTTMESLVLRTDKIFSDYSRRDSPGCALSVIKDGGIVYKQGYGMANLEYNIPIMPSTIFHVASVSKQFTAMAIAMLAHEEKLSLDDDIQKYIPEIHDFGDEIKIHHLVHHTSGIRDQWSLCTLAGWRMDDVITMDDILELLTAQRELNFKPGSEYLYSNSGYTLMAIIVERVSGKPFPEFCKKHIFQPLGMHNTHFHIDHKQIVRKRAYSYELDSEKGYRKAVLSYANAGATSLFTTVEDMALWDRNFYSATVGGEEVIDVMHIQGTLNDGFKIRYAFGLNIGKYRGLKTVEHSGSDAGFRSNILRFPDQKFSVIILSNLASVIPAQLGKKLADIWLENQFPETLTELSPQVTVEPDLLKNLAGTYFSPINHGICDIIYKHGKIFAQLGREIELKPLSQERFKTAQLGLDITIEFIISPGKKDLIVENPGEPVVIYHKLEPYELKEGEKTQYTGTYESPELDTKYYIITENRLLQLSRRKYGRISLKPIFRDAFVFDARGGNNVIQFQRDDDKKIKGFILSTGRVRDLLFTIID